MDRPTALKLLVTWLVAPAAALLFAWVALLILRSVAAVSGDQALGILIGSSVAFGLAALVATGALLSSAGPGAQQGKPGTATRTWHYLVLSAIPISIIGLGAWLYGWVYQRTTVPEGTLAILLLVGVIGLLMAIAVTTVFFHGLSLSDKTEALGLPRGSVRAIIALALILIFALMSIYLYSSVNTTSQQAGQDLAKQLITTVSTLVVAVSAFYFGASSVQAATESVVATRSGRTLQVQGPTPLPKLRRNADGMWDPPSVGVTVQTTPPGLMVKGRVIGDGPSTLTGDGSAFSYAPDHPVDRVLLRFELADDSSISQDIELEVVPPLADGAGADIGGTPVPPAPAPTDPSVMSPMGSTDSPFDRMPGG